MSDIVERLRNQSILDVWHPIMLEAADDIERQRGIISATIEDLQYLKNKQIEAAAEIEKLRAAKAELLRLFDEAMDGYADCMPYKGYYLIEKHGDKENFDDLRAAAAALKETE